MAAPIKPLMMGVCRLLARSVQIIGLPRQVLIVRNNANRLSFPSGYCTSRGSHKHRTVGYVVPNHGIHANLGNIITATTTTSTSTTTLRTSMPMVQLHFLRRWMTSGLTDDMLRKEMEKLTDRFMEAKELLDDARESAGSVYFNEDLEDADKAVEETLAEYKSLLSQLDEVQKQNVMRTIGLKMEELAAQQEMIRESLKD